MKPIFLLLMLYKVCRLHVAVNPKRAPDWVRIIANANPGRLSEAVKIALEDDSYSEEG